MKGSGGFDDAAADLAENLDQLAQELDQQFITTVKETLNATTTSARVQLWVSISIGLFIVIIMMVLYQHILTLLKKLDDSMRNLASGAKDLTSRLDYFGNNEIAKVASCFNAFVGNIGELITDFNQNSQQLGTASNQLALTSNKTLNGMQRRQSETEQVATAMNQMQATVIEVANNAELVAQAAQESDIHALHGDNIVKNTMTLFDHLARGIEQGAISIAKRCRSNRHNLRSHSRNCRPKQLTGSECCN